MDFMQYWKLQDLSPVNNRWSEYINGHSRHKSRNSETVPYSREGQISSKRKYLRGCAMRGQLCAVLMLLCGAVLTEEAIIDSESTINYYR